MESTPAIRRSVKIYGALGAVFLAGTGGLLACRDQPPPEPELPATAAAPAPVTPTAGARSGDGIILFQTDDQVHGVDLASGAAVRLATIPGRAFPGPISPDGRSVVVVSEQDRGEEHTQSLWRLPLDGQPAVDLGVQGVRVRKPAWMPDGTALVFEWDKRSFSDIYQLPLDGTAPHRLTAAEGGSFEPTLAPSGGLLAFASSRDGNAEIYVQGVKDGVVSRVTTDRADDTRPVWLSDSQIVWIGIRGGRAQLMSAKVPDARPFPLYPIALPAANALSGATSTDDARGVVDVIDFAVCAPAARAAVVVRTAAPDQPTRVDIVLLEIGPPSVELGRIASSEQEDTPAWSPDCAALAYSRGEPSEVWVADLNATNQSFLAKGWLPRWARR